MNQYVWLIDLFQPGTLGYVMTGYTSYGLYGARECMCVLSDCILRVWILIVQIDRCGNTCYYLKMPILALTFSRPKASLPHSPFVCYRQGPVHCFRDSMILLSKYSPMMWKWKTALLAWCMGPTWGPSGADRTQAGPMLAPWTLLSGCV